MDFLCQKCTKIYPNMSELRRHDWRSHREIECNRCGENISSRQELKEHRETEHQMVNKIYCRYFPNCMDGDECLYEHGKADFQEIAYGLCPEGVECKNQACKYNDKEHRGSKGLCKFQVNCNRLNCNYKHLGSRKAFLEQEFSKENKK